ncbi:MAG: PAC2 family protein [Propionibacterium sp.]|jgi:hypothetical protein|nr:PAC2 family protein [Propionibacterium sp.]
MLDPAELFNPEPHLESDEYPQPDGERPTLLITLGGYGDAGEAQELIGRQLSERLANHKLGTFDIDQLYDYAGQRPQIIFDRDHFTDYQKPEIALHKVTDDAGAGFFWLSGPEPALQWERMIASIEHVMDGFDIGRVLILQAVPAPTPHTRPIHVSGFASDPVLLGDRDGLPGTFQMSSPFIGLLTLRLGEHGKDVIGLAAHVPYYVAESGYPDAAIALLQQASSVSGLALPSDGSLAQSSETVNQTIEQQVTASAEAQQVVARLEQQYEQYMSHRQITPRANVPTAEEIGAEVEEFLKGLDDGDQPTD